MAPILSVHKLMKRFGGLVVTDDISFDVVPGACFGIIGPNGAGKTTLFNQIAGLLRPDGGEIRFEGKNINGLAPYQICRLGIGRTFQIAVGFPQLTVLESVTTGALVRHRRHGAALKAAEGVLQSLGLDNASATPVEQLTVQQKKRVGVAVALATEPRLLLLDEVMAGLNPTEVQGFIDLLKLVNGRGVTLVVIEHNMRTIRQLCPETLVIASGRTLALGATDDVLKEPAVVQAYLGTGGASLALPQ